MTSLKSQLFYQFMRHQHLLRLQLKRETWDQNTSIPAFRERCEKANAGLAGRLPAGVEVSSLSLGGMHAEWLRPAGAPADRVVLYCIGGGYVSGTCSDHRSIVAKVARATGVAFLLFDHRLAPEHPYPAALDDSLAAYQWLLDQGTAPEQILIMGESAGGGLCLATLLALRDKQMPLPAGAVALSPWTDLALTGESYTSRRKVCISPPGMSEVCSGYYVGDHDPREPWISPLYGDLRGLPPTLIIVGDYETMRDDSTRFAARAQAAGVDVTLRVGEKMVHCYPLMAPLFPEAAAAMNETSAFIRARLGL